MLGGAAVHQARGALRDGNYRWRSRQAGNLFSFMTELVKRAPPLNKKNPTIGTWHLLCRAITRFIVQEKVIADALMTPHTSCWVFLIKG